jgi:hypothetical protein
MKTTIQIMLLIALEMDSPGSPVVAGGALNLLI